MTTTMKLKYCIKFVLYAFNIPVSTSTNPWVNKAICVLLIHKFGTLKTDGQTPDWSLYPPSLLGPGDKMTKYLFNPLYSDGFSHLYKYDKDGTIHYIYNILWDNWSAFQSVPEN